MPYRFGTSNELFFLAVYIYFVYSNIFLFTLFHGYKVILCLIFKNILLNFGKFRNISTFGSRLQLAAIVLIFFCIVFISYVDESVPVL